MIRVSRREEVLQLTECEMIRRSHDRCSARQASLLQILFRVSPPMASLASSQAYVTRFSSSRRLAEHAKLDEKTDFVTR